MELNQAFRNRLGLPAGSTISFEQLDDLLERTASVFPFENFRVLTGKTKSITKENLMEKMLARNEGGLCYELNPLLYHFLQENQLNVKLVRGMVYDHHNNGYSRTGRTHTAILLDHESRQYLIDTGFGGNLPLKPVPLNGEVISSRNGEFRAAEVSEFSGEYMLEMNLSGKDTDWKKGYVFDPREMKESELDEMQDVICHSEFSPFNKNPLAVKITDSGTVTLTGTSITRTENGRVEKTAIQPEEFAHLAKTLFQLNYKSC